MRRGRFFATASVIDRTERSHVLDQHLDLPRQVVKTAALLSKGLVELADELVLVSMSTLEVGDLFVHGSLGSSRVRAVQFGSVRSVRSVRCE